MRKVTIIFIMLILSYSDAYSDISAKTSVIYIYQHTGISDTSVLIDYTESTVRASTLDFLIESAKFAKEFTNLIRSIAMKDAYGAVAAAIRSYEAAVAIKEALGDRVLETSRYIYLRRGDNYNNVKLIFDCDAGTHVTDDTWGSIKSAAPIHPLHFECPLPTGIRQRLGHAEVTIRNINTLAPGLYPIIFVAKEEDCTACLAVVHTIKVFVGGGCPPNPDIPECLATAETVTNSQGELKNKRMALRDFLNLHSAEIDKTKRDWKEATSNCQKVCLIDRNRNRNRNEIILDEAACERCMREVSKNFRLCGGWDVIRENSPICEEYRRLNADIQTLEIRKSEAMNYLWDLGCFNCRPYPSEVQASDGSYEDFVEVTWKRVIGPSAECGYTVSRSTSPNGPWQVIWAGGTSDINSFTDDLPYSLGNTKYYYKVGANAAVNYRCEGADSVTYGPRAVDSGWRRCIGGMTIIPDPEPSFGSNGGSGVIRVKTYQKLRGIDPNTKRKLFYDPACGWTVQCEETWIKIISPSDPVIGDGVIKYEVLPNETIFSRDGVITIGHEEVNIVQSQPPVDVVDDD